MINPIYGQEQNLSSIVRFDTFIMPVKETGLILWDVPKRNSGSLIWDGRNDAVTFIPLFIFFFLDKMLDSLFLN